jgi:hypothetical protein
MAVSPRKARHLVEQLRQRALDLPFQKVGAILEFSGDECDYNLRRQDDSVRWLLIQARGSLIRKSYHYDVMPSHVIAFDTQPGDGCEPANFGLVQ